MTNELLEKTIKKAAVDLENLLIGQVESIKAEIGRKIENTDGGKIKVGIAAAITLAPMGDTCGVKVKISFGEKIKDEAECMVDELEDLPGLEIKKHVEKFRKQTAKIVGPGGSVEISTGGKTVRIEGE